MQSEIMEHVASLRRGLIGKRVSNPASRATGVVTEVVIHADHRDTQIEVRGESGYSIGAISGWELVDTKESER